MKNYKLAMWSELYRGSLFEVDIQAENDGQQG